MTQYEVVKADSPDEAIRKSKWKVGGTAECVGLGVLANSNGTYTLIPEFKPVEIETERSQRRAVTCIDNPMEKVERSSEEVEGSSYGLPQHKTPKES